MMARKRREVIIPEKVVDTHPQQFGDETDVVPVVKIVKEVNTFAEEERVNKISRENK